MHAQPRKVDHLVLPVDRLSVARRRLTDLGFTVAPEALHPFGTANACVFLADKTYLEPLAIADPKVAQAAIAAGNGFVARDALFREGIGEGLSAIVVASDDAESDQLAFADAGLAPFAALDFSRTVEIPVHTLPSGVGSAETSGPSQGEGCAVQRVVARFRLAFAVKPEERFFLFSCQRINPLPADRGPLEHHANGAIGLLRLVCRTPRPEQHRDWWHRVFADPGKATPDGLAFATANLAIDLRRSNTDAGGLVVEALVFAVDDLQMTAARLNAKGVAHQTTPSGIAVPAAPGQGVAFLFEEISR